MDEMNAQYTTWMQLQQNLIKTKTFFALHPRSTSIIWPFFEFMYIFRIIIGAAATTHCFRSFEICVLLHAIVYKVQTHGKKCASCNIVARWLFCRTSNTRYSTGHFMRSIEIIENIFFSFGLSTKYQCFHPFDHSHHLFRR